MTFMGILNEENLRLQLRKIKRLTAETLRPQRYKGATKQASLCDLCPEMCLVSGPEFFLSKNVLLGAVPFHGIAGAD